MDFDIVSRLAANAMSQGELADIIKAARRLATPEQFDRLKAIEKINQTRLTIHQRQGTSDFEGRVAEAMRVFEALLSLKNKKKTVAGYTRRSLKQNGSVEAIKKIISKRDSSGLRLLADRGRLDCCFEQIALDFPNLFQEDDTLAIAQETLERELTGQSFGVALPVPK